MNAHELFAYICVEDANKAVDFYVAAFDAKKGLCLKEPGGRIGHAEVELAGTTLMLSDPFPEMGVTAPTSASPTTVTLHLHVDDADALIERAVSLGATLESPPTDQFYGERSGSIRDPFGYRWLIGHTFEKVGHEEMQRRYDALFD